MKFYLSSQGLGNEPEKLKKLVPKGRIGYIPNALDFTGRDPRWIDPDVEQYVDSLRALGIKTEPLNLRDYFGQQDRLRHKIEELGAVFACGGNIFILRQAMRLSGIDELLNGMRSRRDFLYAGYSAGGCVLAPSLKVYETVEPPETPYPESREVIWEGLGLVDFVFLPHWESGRAESPSIAKAVEYCKRNHIPYKAVRDGEVVILE